MKKILSLLLAVMMLLSCVAITANAADNTATISLNSKEYTYFVGSNITYTCKLTNETAIQNGQFTLNYPENILEITNVETPIVTDGIYNYNENLENMLKFNFSRASSNVSDYYDFSKGGVLIAVTFKISTSGEGTISFDKEVLSNHKDVSVVDSAKFTESLTDGNYSVPKLSATKRNLFVKKTVTLKVTGGSNEKVVWKTSNKKIATVTQTGKVTAKKQGTATITAIKDGVEMKCKITVKNPTVKAKKSTIKVKKSTTITVKNAVGKTTYKSLTAKIAKVTAKGKVTGLKKGTAKIRVVASGVKFTVKIKVK